MDNLTFQLGKAEELPWDDEHFDIVICSEVLEHLPEPEKAISEIYRVLKRDGIGIFSTPNRDTYFARLGWVLKPLFSIGGSYTLGVSARLTSQELSAIDGEHISVKGCGEWIKLFKMQGFRVEKVFRGTAICGGERIDRYPFLFGLILMVDVLLDFIPFTSLTRNWAEQNIFLVRK